jgi:hypothetical protein
MRESDFYNELKAQIDRFMRLEPDCSKQKFTFDGEDFTLESVIDGLRKGILPFYKLDLCDADRAFMNAFKDSLMDLADSVEEDSVAGRLADHLYNQLRMAL